MHALPLVIAGRRVFFQNVVYCCIEKDSCLLLFLHFDKLFTVEIYLPDQLKFLVGSISGSKRPFHIFTYIYCLFLLMNINPSSFCYFKAISPIRPSVMLLKNCLAPERLRHLLGLPPMHVGICTVLCARMALS